MTKTTNKTTYIILALATFSLLAVAGSARLFTSGKLSSSLINCVTQDKYGYIWVGTEYGLNKFDGYNFTSYLNDSSDSTSVTDNTITAFLVDHSGRLWIGSAKGLMRYDYETDKFVRYSPPGGRRMRIYSIIESHNGDILIGSAGFGLYSIRKGSDEMTYEKQYSSKDSDVFFTHIFEDRQGNLWQSSHENDFKCYRHRDGRIETTTLKSPVGAPVKFFQTDNNHLLIICMGGLLNYDFNTGKINPSSYDLGSYKGHITINSAIFDPSGNLYLGTSENGILTAGPTDRKFTSFNQPTATRFDLSTAYIKDLFVDKDNNLWAGCYRKGLYLVNNEQMAFNSWTFSSQNYSIGSSVSSIAHGSDGDIWCAVQNSGVFQFGSDGKIVSHPKSPSGTSIIYRDRQGEYWTGTGNGLYSYNPSTGSYTQKVSYESDGTYCITDNGKGKIFVSAYSKGLYVYDKTTGETKRYSMTDKISHGRLCNDWIRSMTIDHNGLLWIGTSNGVSCFNPDNGHFDNFKWDYLLYNIQTNYLCEDHHGNILIGTDDGLYIYYRNKGKTALFPHSEQLRGKQICGIAVDNTGDLWISTTSGIWQYDHSRKMFIGHISGNGLKAKEYTLGSVLQEPDGLIAFGFGDGITTFYPDKVRNMQTTLGEVHLTGFIINGKQKACMTDEYSLPYSEHSFTLEFSMLNYKNPDNVCFQYRINGGEWASTDEGVNSIPFVNLEPGKYEIDVRAYNNGRWSDKTKRITIRVRHPWYSSPIAITLYLLLLATIAYVCFKIYLRRKKTEDEEAKMRFLIDATHDIKSPLTLIMGPLHKLKEHLSDDKESLQYISTIDHNAHRLLLLVNQILDERKIDKNQMRLKCRKTEMVSFLNGICNLYRTGAEERNINLRFVPNVSKLNAWVDPVNFDKVISNLLSNAIKYTFDGGTIDVVVDSIDGNMRIDVMDTGIGLKDSNINRIFDRFYRSSSTSGVHIDGAGIGLNLCKNIVKMHGGTIGAANRTDVSHGSDFFITIPLGTEHLRDSEIATEEEPAVITPKANGSASKNYHILIVDDDQEIGLYINNELSSWYHFDYSPNGKDALRKLLTDNFDLVISDVKMPEMDGITLLKKIKSNSNISDIPVILLTSKSDAQDRLEGLKKGADAYLAKPFDMDELHALIDNLVGNVRRLRGKFSGAQEQKDKVVKIEVKGNDDALMERIMKEINAHMQDPEFNVEILSKNVGISRAQLHRKMKEMTGISTGDFIRNIRLEQAARLLSKGDINITQVAFAVGFNNQTHFSTVFKKHYGMTPTEYSAKFKKDKNI